MSELNSPQAATTVDLARTSLEGILHQLESIDRSLEKLLEILPEGSFEPETDQPENRAAELYGTVACLRDDELHQILTILSGAVQNLE